MRATFEIVFLTGWAPAPDQPQPLAESSRVASLDFIRGIAVLGKGVTATS